MTYDVAQILENCVSGLTLPENIKGKYQIFLSKSFFYVIHTLQVG